MSIFDFFFERVQRERGIPKKKGLQTVKSKLVTLIILDGFGTHPDPLGNAILQARTPFLDRAWTLGRSTLIHASGTHVGLPENEPGNSEVGHLSIGTGQVIYQSLSRINDAIAKGEFDKVGEIAKALEEVKSRGVNLHLVGVLSAAGVHGHIEHLYELLKMSKEHGINPFIHAMTDGRDTPPTDGYYYISKLVQKIKEIGAGRIASVGGRFYGMDRDKRWERTQKAYESMVGLGERREKDVFSLVQEAYKRGENDELLTPTTVVDGKGEPVGQVKNNDVVIFFNFREDRARQLTKVFVDPDFKDFTRAQFPENVYFVTMTGYSEDLDTHVIFPPKPVKEPLALVLSKSGKRQFHISETEKFTHITYFFNGGVENPHAGEDFFNIPSPRVFDYSSVPQMSAYAIKDETVHRIEQIDKNGYSFVLVNFANPDMVGHTGNIDAAIKACEVSDECTRDIAKKTVEKGGVCIIIADHGNCETMIDRITKKVDRAHTNNPVPFILVHDISQVDETKEYKLVKVGTGKKAHTTGILADVAPTVLEVLDLEKSNEMTGVNLLDFI